MKRRVLRKLSMLLGWVAGITACGSSVTPLYGMLEIPYDLDGTVVREGTSTPIPGIEVDFEGNVDTTDARGEWSLYRVWGGDCWSECRVIARDVDGSANGRYKETEVRFIPRRYSNSSGSGSTSGNFAYDIEIEMSPVSDDLEQ